MLFGAGKKNAPAAPGPEAGSADIIFDVSAADFETRVLQASMARPVIVDFWAPWCGPCKTLGPLLEQAVRQAGGTVAMAKVNLDENQELAAALRIQSIPTVYAFFQGRPVDAFTGALPESEIRGFVHKLVQAARAAQPESLDIPETLKAAAQALAENNLAAAQGLYGQILAEDDANVQAYAGLVRVLIAAGNLQKARSMLDGAPEDIARDPHFREARTALELAEEKPAGALDDLRARVEKNPADHQARFDLARALFAEGRREEAIDNLLEIMRRDREWEEDKARKQLLKFFEAMGPADPLTAKGRRKLSSVLFS